jgi:hypothetical protein
MKGPIDTPQPRQSAEFTNEQHHPVFRRMVKQNIQRGFPRQQARTAARATFRKLMSRGKGGQS